jgi:hypothetical protein
VAAAGGALVARALRPGGRPALTGAVLAVVLLSGVGRLLGVGTGQVGVQPGLNSDAFSAILAFTDTVDRTTVTQWSDQERAAGDWLRANSASTDLVASNVTLSPLIPALSARPTLATGLLYQAPYGRPGSLSTLLERESASWAFIDAPTEVTAATLCRAGVDWVWVDQSRTATSSWDPFATVVLRNADVSVLRLDGCPDGT